MASTESLVEYIMSKKTAEYFHDLETILRIIIYEKMVNSKEKNIDFWCDLLYVLNNELSMKVFREKWGIVTNELLP